MTSTYTQQSNRNTSPAVAMSLAFPPLVALMGVLSYQVTCHAWCIERQYRYYSIIEGASLLRFVMSVIASVIMTSVSVTLIRQTRSSSQLPSLLRTILTTTGLICGSTLSVSISLFPLFIYGDVIILPLFVISFLIAWGLAIALGYGFSINLIHLTTDATHNQHIWIRCFRTCWICGWVLISSCALVLLITRVGWQWEYNMAVMTVIIVWCSGWWIITLPMII